MKIIATIILAISLQPGIASTLSDVKNNNGLNTLGPYGLSYQPNSIYALQNEIPNKQINDNSILLSAVTNANSYNYNLKSVSGAGKSAPKFGASATLSVMSMPFPMGKGVELFLSPSEKWRLGFSYIQSSFALNMFSFDIGEIKETDYSLHSRYFPRNGSFNFVMGLGRRTVSARLAQNLFDLALGNYSLMVSELQSNIVQLGLANQWNWKNRYLITVDWIKINVAVYGNVLESASRFAKDDRSRKAIKKAESALSWTPNGALLGLSFGVRF